MKCCNENTANTKTARLTFKRAELLYDIENYSYIEGDTLSADNVHTKHQVFDIGQAGNVDRVSRILDLAYSECVELLYPYTKKETADDLSALDNELVAPEEFIIELSLPENFSTTTLELLKKLIHEYLVCRVLADWMSITNPAGKKKWEEKLFYLKEKIHTTIVSRTRILRRKLKPF